MSVSVFLALLSAACTETDVVKTIECDDAETVQVVSIKHARKLGYAQRWGFELRSGGARIPVKQGDYPGFLPARIKRRVLGKQPERSPDSRRSPHGEAFSFFLGDVPEDRRASVEACLVKHDEALRAGLLLTRRLKNHPPGQTINRFVYWRGGPEIDSPRFKNGETELALLDDGTVYFNDVTRGVHLRVGGLRWRADGTPRGIEVDLSPRQNLGAPGRTLVIAETDPSTYLHNGEDLSRLLKLPYLPSSTARP